MKMMKKGMVAVATGFMAVAVTAAAWYTPGNAVEIGDAIPASQVPMMDVSGETTFLRQEMGANGLLVVFSCNTCPFVLQWEDRYNPLFELCEKNDIGMVLINSNEAKRSGDDSFEAMKEKAKAEGYKMKYLVDEGHKVADAFGARTTPHIFLFSQHAKLAYRGSIDDNSEYPDQVENRYLEDAINAMLADKPIDPNTTRSIGCSIKRVK